MNKLGSYITKLMTIIIDKEEEDQFVKNLAMSELKGLGVEIQKFIKKHQEILFDKTIETHKKQLLQEDKNVKNK
tara:strand:- start:588 stop:809 length:222 start_codon:yes stop_codon:yes gene_type:complete